MINVHTHIFNVKCAPDRFYGFPVARFFSHVPGAARRLARWLRFINPFSNQDMLERYAKMIEVGAEKTQRNIFTRLLDYYPPETKIVALTLDMDYMGAGAAVNNYVTQLNEVAALKAQFPEQLIAFFCVDPRRPDVLPLLKEYVGHRGFTGIKLYPALGFYPFDERLRPVYEYAVEKRLPLLTHCDIGGIYYRGPLDGDQLAPASLNRTVPRRSFSKHAEAKRTAFKDFFTDPLNFVDVLTLPEFRELKICLAHYGGSEMIEGKARSLTGNNWYASIRDMMLTYDNVYTDISYTLHHTHEKVRQPVMADIRDAGLGKKILFGTDYYMTVREKDEATLVSDFKNRYGLTAAEFHQLAVTNNRAFLTTTFFAP
ncbi:MAG: amidohydrolase family protein [Cyclobacteriaceae bacterium]|jgi:predicted TIM-barrel fold metal-dependent hydrolase